MKRLAAPVVGWRAVPVAAMLGLVLLGSAIRLVGLAAPDGRLDAEGTRLALAADGVLRHGLPRLPTGRVYPRGVVNSYAIAASFALIGRSDFAARLPSAIAGILLIPLLFLLGRSVVGPTVGLAAAGFVALAEPLVEWSRSPWLPSIFLLLFCAAAYCCHRGFVCHQGRWQLAAAGVASLALLSYEFGMLLLLALGLYLGARALRGDHRWHRGPSTWLALALLGAGALLSVTLVLLLRVGTLAGPFGELGFYVTPGWEPRGLLYYLHRPLGDYPWLLAAAVLAVASPAGRRIAGVSYFGILLAVAILVPSFGIRVKQEERYVIAALPLVGLLGPTGILIAGRRLTRWPVLPDPVSRMLSVIAATVLLGVSLAGDAWSAGDRLRAPTPGPTWLQRLEALGPRPDDLVLSSETEVSRFYLGHSDFYVLPEGNDEGIIRSTYWASGGVRSAYTDAIVLSRRGDFERLVERPHAGRDLWIIGPAGSMVNRLRRLDPDLWPFLVRSADVTVRTRDRWVLLKVRLPMEPASPPANAGQTR